MKKEHFLKSIFKQNKKQAKSNTFEKKAIKGKDISEFYKQAAFFSEEKLNILYRSKQKWKILFFVAMVFSFFLLLMLLILTPLKKTVPYIIEVDSLGNMSAIDPGKKNIIQSKGAVMNKYFLRTFVINYNEFDIHSIQHNFDVVQLMSNSSVFNTYKQAVTSKDAPLNVFKYDDDVKVTINNISFLPTDKGQRNIAQVLYTTKVIQSNDGKLNPVYGSNKYLATIEFDYDKKITSGDDQLINPLGFQVVSYSVTQEK